MVHRGFPVITALVAHWSVHSSEQRRHRSMMVNSTTAVFSEMSPNWRNPPDVVWMSTERHWWYSGEHSCLPSSWPGFDSRPMHLISDVSHWASEWIFERAIFTQLGQKICITFSTWHSEVHFPCKVKIQILCFQNTVIQLNTRLWWDSNPQPLNVHMVYWSLLRSPMRCPLRHRASQLSRSVLCH